MLCNVSLKKFKLQNCNVGPVLEFRQALGGEVVVDGAGEDQQLVIGELILYPTQQQFSFIETMFTIPIRCET